PLGTGLFECVAGRVGLTAVAIRRRNRQVRHKQLRLAVKVVDRLEIAERSRVNSRPSSAQLRKGKLEATPTKRMGDTYGDIVDVGRDQVDLVSGGEARLDGRRLQEGQFVEPPGREDDRVNLAFERH